MGRLSLASLSRARAPALLCFRALGFWWFRGLGFRGLGLGVLGFRGLGFRALGLGV